jgi:hypothetical protein
MVVDKPALSQVLFYDALRNLRGHIAVDYRRNSFDAHFNERFGEAQTVASALPHRYGGIPLGNLQFEKIENPLGAGGDTARAHADLNIGTIIVVFFLPG